MVTSTDANNVFIGACVLIGLVPLIIFFDKVVYPLYQTACAWIWYLITLLCFVGGIVLFGIYGGYVPMINSNIPEWLQGKLQEHTQITIHP